MVRRRHRLAPSLFLCVATAVAACQGAPRFATGGRSPPTPQAAAMRRMAADMLAIRGHVDGSVDAAGALERAGELVELSGRLGELFPPESAARRYPELSEAMLRAAPASMQASTERLLAAVRGGDRLAISQELTAVEEDGCGACHR
jgi:cytochrome c556